MSAAFDSITNRGEYFAAHYFAEQLPQDLRRGILAEWSNKETDEYETQPTAREALRTLRSVYLSEDVRAALAVTDDSASDVEQDLLTYGSPIWGKTLRAWHQDVLRALGFQAEPTTLTVHRSGREHEVTVAYHGDGVIALDCGWSGTVDGAVEATGAGRLLDPLRITGQESYETGTALASWLFQSEIGRPDGPPPRFVLLLTGGVIVLADRNTWNEGRYLAASLDVAIERNDRAQYGELATIAALFSQDMLGPGSNDPAPALDRLLKASGDNAVGVNKDLRKGLRRSVEIIANEVLHRMAETGNDITTEELADRKIPFAQELTRESLRYLYRILFLLYAEARPELHILPADDGSYEAGYSVARLREIVSRNSELVEDEARNGFHLFESLDVLFTKVNTGHRRYGTEPDDEQPGDDAETLDLKRKRRSEDRGLRFEALRSQLFDPASVRIIGRPEDPRTEDDVPQRLDLRLRNSALHEVLRLLTMKPARRNERGGFISYRNLGINQLGAVYEGLMSYTGIIATEELCEVAKKGDPEEGSWLIPADRQSQYPDDTLVKYDDEDARHGLRGVKKYPQGSFVYRLSGRERETSASYYTPESLTKVTVELALKHLMDQKTDDNGNTIRTRAAEILDYKVCEPALGSGAFLNEAINQLAEEYLRRRQDELQTSIPTSDVLTEKQKVKAYIALHNAYGVDLNPTGVELAEVSLWLNTMHPGMQAPWFGLHLRRGNSLFGARRAVYSAEDVASTEKAWLKAKNGLGPTPLPFLKDGEPQELPEDAIHQFLLPSPGWGAVVTGKETALAKKLAPEAFADLAAWRKGILQRPLTKVPKGTHPKPQFTRLREVARRVEFLWHLVIQRMEISEREVARRIDVWGADQTQDEFSFMLQPEQVVPKEKILDDLFNAAETPYWRLKMVMDAWCALWFWPLEDVGLLDGTDPLFKEVTATTLALAGEERQAIAEAIPDSVPPAPVAPRIVEVIPEQAPVISLGAPRLFAMEGDQMAIDEVDVPSAAPTPVKKKGQSGPPKPKVPKLRPIIPLKDFADWLDFLEAMLGTTDVSDEMLTAQFKSLDELSTYEETLPGFMGMVGGDPEQRFPWLGQVQEIAEKQGFLHWELEFALTFARRGGFDLQVGNPPWVRPRWDLDAVLAEHDPWFELIEKPSASEKSDRVEKTLVQKAVAGSAGDDLVSTLAQVGLLSSPQMYELLAGTQPDLYRGFMQQVWRHMSATGTAGMLHPDTHFSGDKEMYLREAAYRRLRVHGDFVNAGNRFFPHPVGRHTHFGVHIYGSIGEISFQHLSWLFSTEALRLSASDNGSAPAPSVRHGGDWDERPHQARVVQVSPDVLEVWRRLLEDEAPTSQARLLFPVSTEEADALQALAEYPSRMAALHPRISRGLEESGAKSLGLIDYNAPVASGRAVRPTAWQEVILKGPQLGVANPMFKQPSQNVDGRPMNGLNLELLGADAVAETEYVRSADVATYRSAHDSWLDYQVLDSFLADPKVVSEARAEIAEAVSKPESAVSDDEIASLLRSRSFRSSLDFYRLAWRRQIAPNTERALYAALVPPGASHIHMVHSLALASPGETAMVAGFWASLPLDYFLRSTGRGDLQVTGARIMPAPDSGHPLASSLLLRSLRLNCLTNAYADLWKGSYESAWRSEEWACQWPGLPRLSDVDESWSGEIPLRTERSRRSALVELDALVAVWIGMSADALVAAYRARYPVLQDFEQVTWFDAQGHKIAGHPYTVGYGQKKEDWGAFQAYLKDPEKLSPPEGYVAPFYKADREAEMREAHAVFTARLNDAIARGEWDPERREVPKK
ncbi:hypothetical protein [Kineosporia babensis]|uniref:site-specific DNA-methyltransferase (adenine-specific) n=1 Tax=Kineosporia babensis TaxID=499548 RepID=A0A9X1NNQ1_9ACTN|nr:hypothetical protein [Kineosporia babensis]MCD5317101.1 hypothetical protein [Kineosporia babensis]